MDMADLQHMLENHIQTDDRQFGEIQQILANIKDNHLAHMQADSAVQTEVIKNVQKEIANIKEADKEKRKWMMGIAVGILMLLITSIYRLIAI